MNPVVYGVLLQNGVLEEQDLLEVGVEDPSHRRYVGSLRGEGGGREGVQGRV